MREIMENDAPEALRTIEKSEPYYVEMFAVGDQGANVAMTNKPRISGKATKKTLPKLLRSGRGNVLAPRRV